MGNCHEQELRTRWKKYREKYTIALKNLNEKRRENLKEWPSPFL
jgi:hypothetical protein